MLREKFYFKFFWGVTRYFGLQPQKLNRYEKNRALRYFLILTIPFYTLFLISLAIGHENVSKLESLQSLPFFIQMLLEGLNFTVNSKKIEEIFNKLDKLFVKISAENFFKKAFKIFMIYAIFENFSTFLTFIGGISIFWRSEDKSDVQLYIPSSTLSATIIVGLLQGAFTAYSGLLNALLDQILIGLVIFLSFYLKAVRKELRKMKIEDVKEIVQILTEVKR